MALSIPPSEVATVRALVQMTAAAREGLVRAFRDTPVKPSVSAFVDEVACHADGDGSSTRDIVWLFLSLEMLRTEEDTSATEIAQDLVNAARAFLTDDSKGIDPKEVDWNRLIEDVSSIFSCHDSLGVMVKAATVLQDNERFFSGAHIITDLRPVFGADPADTPAAGVIVHTLRVDHRSDAESFYVVLDRSGLEHLRDAIARALQKETGLRKMADRMGLPLIGDVDTTETAP